MWVSGAQGQLDDAVGIFRFRDRLMLTQKKKSQLNGMDCNYNYPFYSIGFCNSTFLHLTVSTIVGTTSPHCYLQ